MKIYDIRPPIKRQVAAVKKTSVRYWQLAEKFIKHSRYGIPLLVVFCLFLAGVIISAITQTEIKTIRALPQEVSGDWQAVDNAKSADLKDDAQYHEFNRLNSSYPYQEFSEINLPAVIDLSASSSENIDASTSAATTSYFKRLVGENFFTRLFKQFILGVKAQAAPADTTGDTPISPPVPETPPSSVQDSGEAQPAPETAPTDATPPATETLTPAVTPETSSSSADTSSEPAIILPNVDGVVTSTDEIINNFSTDTGLVPVTPSSTEKNNDYHLFANKKELRLTNFTFESLPGTDAEFKGVNLNLSLMMGGGSTSTGQLLIEYATSSDSWQEVTTLKQNRDYSNNLDGGYLAFPLPIAPSDVSNLSIRITSLSDARVGEPVFLDAAWLDVSYISKNIKLSKDELKARAKNLPRANIKNEALFELKSHDFLATEDATLELNFEKFKREVNSRGVASSSAKATEDKTAGTATEVIPREATSTETKPDKKVKSNASSSDKKIEEATSSVDISPPTDQPNPTSSPPLFPENFSTSSDGISGSLIRANGRTTNTSVLESSFQTTRFSWLGSVAFAQGASSSDPLLEPQVIGATMTDPDGNATNAADFIVGEGATSTISLPKPDRAFRPGKYSLEVEILLGNTVYVTTQDFTWGVLAINTNKSIFVPGETAYLQMAALTDAGETICNAPLKLEIISPATKTATASSSLVTQTSENASSSEAAASMPENVPASTTTADIVDSLIRANGRITNVVGTSTLSADALAGTSTVLSTENGQIISMNGLAKSTQHPVTKNPSTQPITSSGQCGKNNLTDVPDYFAHYLTQEAGIYTLKLTNLETAVSITDSFEVKNEVDAAGVSQVPFVVERVGPTRINPRFPYTMKFSVTPRENFVGKMKEIVPAGFAINPPSATDIPSEGGGLKDAGLPQVELGNSGIEQYITWDVNLLAGQTRTFIYAFDAPDISPEFYLLGPLRFYNAGIIQSLGDIFGISLPSVFEEARKWQIASDATGMKIRQEINILDGVWSSSDSNLSGWSVATANTSTPAGVAYTGGQEGTESGIAFKSDGTKMYMVGINANKVWEYNLATPWSVATANTSTPAGVASVVGQDTSVQDVTFKSDGTKMYVMGNTNDKVYEYDLATPWSVSTANTSTVAGVAYIGGQDTTGTGVTFKSDGTKMYVMGNTNDKVWEYDLATPWSVSTANTSTPAGVASVGGQETNTVGVTFKSDGTKMYMIGNTIDKVWEYDLATPWSVSTANTSTPAGVASIVAQDGGSTGVAFKSDGTKMYMVGINADKVWEYNITATSSFSSARVQLDQIKYAGSGESYYFEIVAKTSISFAASTTLRSGSSETNIYTDIKNLDIPAGTTSYTRLRSGAFNPTASTTNYVVFLPSQATGTVSIKAARIIILQSSSTITTTETQIEIGNQEKVEATTTSPLANPKYWKYDSTLWDGSPTVYAEATFAAATSSGNVTVTTLGSNTINWQAEVNFAKVEAWGAGGGGGSNSTTNDGASGGGGGAYASRNYYVAGATATAFIGTGGATTTTFGINGTGSYVNTSSTFVYADGGKHGREPIGGLGGVAGTQGSSTVSVGSVKTSGGNGGAGIDSPSGTGGGGGGSGGDTTDGGNGGVGGASGGTAGAAGTTNGALGGVGGGVAQNGLNGVSPGGGGGGSGDTTRFGGFGAGGQVKVSWIASTTIYLQEDDGSFGSWTNTSTIVTASASTTPSRARSASFVPKSNRNYRLAVIGDTGVNIYNAKIVVDQQTTPTKLEPQYLLLNTADGGTGLQTSQTIYNSTEWDQGDGTLTFKHALDSDNSSNSADLEDIDNSNLGLPNSSTTGANQQISSAITMPPTGHQIDTKVFNSTGVIAASRILAQYGFTSSSPPISVAGTVYLDEGSTKTSSDIKLVVNGVTAYTTSTEPGSTYKFDAVTAPVAGDTITVWMNNNGGASGTGAVVTRYNSGNITGLDIYKSDVIVRHENGTPVGNSDIGKCTNNQGSACSDSDIHIASSTSAITISSDTRLYLWTGKTYTPGGTLTLYSGAASSSVGGDLKWGASNATLDMAGNALSVGGDWLNSAKGTFSRSAGETVTFNATSSQFSIDVGNNGAQTFDNVIFNGFSNAVSTWSFATSTTISSNLTMTTGTLTGSKNITVNGGNTTGGGVINLADGIFLLDGTGNFGGTTTWNFAALTFGDGSGNASTTDVGNSSYTASSTLTIAANQQLMASSTYILTGSGTPFTITGAFTEASSTFSYRSTSATSITRTHYYGLDFKPPSGSPTYTLLGGGTLLVNGSMTVGDGSNYVWVNADTNDPVVDVTYNYTVAATATSTASASAAFNVGGNWSVASTANFFNSGGTVTFDSGATGRTIDSGGTGTGKNFGSVVFNNSSGGWTMQSNNLTTTGSLTITNLNSLTLQAARILEVDGAYSVCDACTASTTWTDSTLYLNSATNYTVGSKNQSTETYGTLQVGANTDIRDWKSSAGTTTVDSIGSLYSQNNAGTSGALNIYGDDHVLSGNSDYWAYKTDFDGTDISGSPRQAVVKIGTGSDRVRVDSSGNLNIKGGGGGANQFTDVNVISGSTYNLFNSGSATTSEAKMASSTFASGTWTMYNTQLTNQTMGTGTINVDWYWGTHVVDKTTTSTNIDTGSNDITISESSGSSTVFKLASNSWGSGATSKTTGTNGSGLTPEPTTDNAVRVREYSRTPSATSSYKYNLAIVATSTYSAYNYFSDYGSNYIGSIDNTAESANIDKVIGANWYRDTIATQNADAAVNDPPVRGTLEAGMTSTGGTLAFTLDSISVSLGTLSTGNNFTGTATNLLTVSTNATHGFNMYAYETDLMKNGTTNINDWPGTNAVPTSWTSTCIASSQCGFGYSTNDADLTQFSSTKYAGFTSSTPGDVVATAPGTVTNDATTITYRMSINTSKKAGNYSTTIIYLLVPIF